MPTAHCISTTDGIILAVDHNFLILMQREEKDLIGRSYRDFTVPNDLERSATMLAGLIDRAGPTQLRKRYLRPDGTVVQAELLVTKFADSDRLITTLSFDDRVDGAEAGGAPDRLWRAALQLRHMNDIRKHELGADLFTDHLTAIIIEIYLAEAEARIVSIQNLSRAMNMALNSVIRWLSVLESRGLIELIQAAGNAVQFTYDGLRAVERILAATLHAAPNGHDDRAMSE